MRKAKMRAAERARTKVKHHTPAERMALKREKQRNGPCKVRRRERRAHLQAGYVAPKE